MARISIMEALARVLTASKDYTDEKSILLDEDDGTFGGFFEGAYPELNTVNKTPIGAVNEINSNVNSKQNITDNMLETESKTVVGAINELKINCDTIEDELVIENMVTLEFDLFTCEKYEHIVTSTEYGTTYYKIAEADVLPNMDEIPLSPYMLTLYDNNNGGIIEVPAYIEKYVDYNGRVQYYIHSEDDAYFGKIMILFENYNPGTPYTFTPGAWVLYKNYNGSITYPISVTIGGSKTIKEELENKADLVDEQELKESLEGILGITLEGDE